MTKLLDAKGYLPPEHWPEKYHAYKQGRLAKAAALVSAQKAKPAQVGPSLPLDRYVGDYADPWYGTIKVRRAGNALAIQFPHSTGMDSVLVHYQYDTFRTQRPGDRRHRGSLARHGQRLGAASFQQGLGIGGKGRRGANGALEPLAKLVTPHRFRNGPARGLDPQAAAGQLALQIGDDVARRGDHKPDQLVDRPHLATDRAHPHGRGLVGPRPIVEIGVSQSEHACLVAPVICARSARRSSKPSAATRA